ncbi:MAG: glycosyltransferase, partial [Chloroflexi bacterium]|nr:glycosyltransferase [Chloroflexota bacterium]
MKRPGGAAIVHDYFVQDGGAERCAVELADLLPQALISTTFFHDERFGERIDPRRVRTWPLQRLIGPTERFRALLPLYPLWFSAVHEQSGLVISSTSGFAHGVRTRRDALHVAYVHTPMRFGWDLDLYLEGSSFSPPARLAGRALRPLLQRWDRDAAARPDILVANSLTIQERIARLWGRSAEIIHPPVDTAEFPLSDRDDGFLLVASRMLAYRRLDLAVKAATALRRDLVVVGDGPERRRLRAMAGPTVRFLGHVPRWQLQDLVARSHAYILPGLEDFGIAAVEAMAAGKPVIAFRGGGATETVQDGVTGVFFDRPDARSLAEAVKRLDSTTFDGPTVRQGALRFDVAVFRAKWRALLQREGVDPHL